MKAIRETGQYVVIVGDCTYGPFFHREQAEQWAEAERLLDYEVRAVLKPIA